MRNFLPVFLCLSLLGSAVPTIEDWKMVKTAPEHIGIAPEMLEFELSYKTLASIRNIRLKKRITMGFSSIKMKKGTKIVIGLCTFGKFFREIDADIKYWKNASWTTKRTLMYHEMTHCLCGREHDWGDGVKYPDPDTTVGKIEIAIKTPFYKIQPGFTADGCPLSIMHPYIISDACVRFHWSEYEKEMLNRCEPY